MKITIAENKCNLYTKFKFTLSEHIVKLQVRTSPECFCKPRIDQS